jgi:hypothetical protein
VTVSGAIGRKWPGCGIIGAERESVACSDRTNVL